MPLAALLSPMLRLLILGLVLAIIIIVTTFEKGF